MESVSCPKTKLTMKILIDNGHGQFTAGKRSPDGLFREYYSNREIARRIVSGLKAQGYDAELLVPEADDISLKERTRRVNAACLLYGKKNVILVSIHSNAAGNGSKWMNAQGWSCYTCKGQTQSDILATCLYEEAHKNFKGRKIREDWSDGDPDYEENFYILKNTWCPAVLTESFFYDNLNDLCYLESHEGKEAIIRTHIDGIISYLDNH